MARVVSQVCSAEMVLWATQPGTEAMMMRMMVMEIAIMMAVAVKKMVPWSLHERNLRINQNAHDSRYGNFFKFPTIYTF